MLGFSKLDDAYKKELIRDTIQKETYKPYYKAVARKDGQFDLYPYKDGYRDGEPTIVDYSTVKSLRKDNTCVSVEGAWVG